MRKTCQDSSTTEVLTKPTLHLGETMRRLCLLICLLVLPRATAVSEDATHRRWALIGTAEVVESGLPDLLTVELSKQDTIELVEREQLQEAMRELQLAALTKPDQVKQRLQLGRTLRADALMVMSFEHRREPKRMNIVVCDSKLGVRLWRGALAAGDVEQLVEQCVTVVDEVRQRFAGGIHHIVAVPPFLSEDFDQRFDYLQSRYSELLSSRMMAYAGVAAVEIDEARAIVRELDDTLSDGLDRPISTIVKGSYTVTAPARSKRRSVQLQINLIRSETERERIEKTLPFGQVSQWLVNDLATRLRGAVERNGAKLSPEVQTRILIRHAQRFAELGDWQRSCPLREAALTLNPGNVLQRGLLVREYQFSVARAVDYTWFKNLPSLKEKEPELRRAAHDYQVGLDHLAYLVRNKSIKRRDAAGLFMAQRWQRSQGSGHPDARKYFAALEPARVAQREFVREMFPLIIDLPEGHVLPRHLTDPYYGWQYAVTKHVVDDVAFNGYSTASLAGLEDLLTRVLPESTKTSDLVQGTFWHGSVYTKDAARENWVKLLQTLVASEHELAKLYGRWGQLLLDREATDARLAKLESLSSDLTELGREDGKLFKRLGTDIQMTKNRLAVIRNPPQPTPGSQRPYSAADYFSLGRVQLEPLRLRVEGEEGSYRPLIKGMLQCGDQCDAYWTEDRFFLMRTPGVLSEVKLTDDTNDGVHFWSATWDGECLWIYARGNGIVAVRPDGTIAATFRQREHIPGFWKGFGLVGLSSRRALMVGSFGSSNRAWCGILEIDEQGEQSADVFFEAKYVADGRDKQRAEDDPHTAFQPQRVLHVQDDAGKSCVMILRKDLSKYLRIDPDTRKVSIGGIAGDSTKTDLGFRGRTFLLDGKNLAVLAPRLQNAQVLQYVFHDGWLYAFGRFWYRVHLETGREERLQPAGLRMPTNLWNIRGGPSAHYGLVVHHLYQKSPPLYRVTIADPSRP